jgi:hypothetical protein
MTASSDIPPKVEKPIAAIPIKNSIEIEKLLYTTVFHRAKVLFSNSR